MEVIARIIKNIKFKTKNTPIDVTKIIKNKETLPVWSNQFISVFNLQKLAFEYVQPTIREVLNIKPKDFTIAALYGLDPENKFYHPEDLIIHKRMGTLCYLVLASSGLEIDASTFYLHQKYRIRISNYRNGEYFCVAKKAYIIKESIEVHSKTLLKHLYYWNIIDNLNNYEKFSISFNKAGNNKEYYLNQMLYIFNAQLFGFSTKEIYFLHYWNKYKITKDISFEINKTLEINQFTSRKVSDYIYRLGKKIIETYKNHIIINEIEKDIIALINTKNALIYASKLGLLDFDEKIIKLILK